MTNLETIIERRTTTLWLTRAMQYLAIARPDHWVKNVFMLFGTGALLIVHPMPYAWDLFRMIGVSLASVCLIASSNYVLNEILDAEFDRQHFEKRNRPLASGELNRGVAYAEWVALGAVGLAIAWTINRPFFVCGAWLWLMGIIYNVRPIRSKEVPVIDVLSEAINNPIRFLLGWYALGNQMFPPSSMLLAYWMLGAFFMAGKRFAEYREIGNPVNAASYRRSFKWYTEERLLVSMCAYVSGFMFFFAVVMTKYHPELILAAPFIIGMVGYVTKLCYEPRSIVQHPERLFTRPKFMAYSIGCTLLLLGLAEVSIPSVRMFLGLDGPSW